MCNMYGIYVITIFVTIFWIDYGSFAFSLLISVLSSCAVPVARWVQLMLTDNVVAPMSRFEFGRIGVGQSAASQLWCAWPWTGNVRAILTIIGAWCAWRNFVMCVFYFSSIQCAMQLTASIDLAQTQFKCCAINSDLNYDMSLWRLQGYGQRDWVVPQTCCTLNNRLEPRSYLDPKPQNLTMCQSLLKHEYQRARHTDICIEHLDLWYRQHYTLFLSASAVVGIVEFAVLLSIILSCTRLSAKTKRRGNIMFRSTGTSMQSNVLASASANQQPAEHRHKRRPAPQPNQVNNNNLQKALTALENVYISGNGSGMAAVNGIGGAVSNGINRRSIRDNHMEPIKLPNAYSYHLSKSYLV